MTTFERFEHSIPELMTELAPARVPDYFDDMLRETAKHRQRPAWSYLERWLPVEITAPLTTRSFPWRSVAILALIAMIIAAGLVAYAGSQPKLPPPFGAAGNGVLIYRDGDGSIRSVDPRTGSRSVIAAGSEGLGEPIPSRDGRRIAFIPRSSTPSPIVVAQVDGSKPTPLAGMYRDIEDVDWSPDDAHIAFVSNGGGAAVVTVAATDGSDTHTLSLGRDVWQLTYLPDGRLAVIAPERQGDQCPGDTPNSARCALFLVEPDGTELEQLMNALEFRAIEYHPSPDGTRIVWVEWAAGAEGRLHVTDVRDGTDRLLPVDIALPYNINQARFSPDGASILFDLFEADGDHWAVVPATGGQVTRIGPEWPGETPAAFWAPDGRSVLSLYPVAGGANEMWLLDPTGEGADRRLEIQVPTLPAWQRVGT